MRLIVVDGGAVLLAIPRELGSHRLAGQLCCAPVPSADHHCSPRVT